jgi:hypothetical protein
MFFFFVCLKEKKRGRKETHDKIRRLLYCSRNDVERVVASVVLSAECVEQLQGDESD